MIERGVEWRKGAFDFEEVDHPAGRRIDRPFQAEFDAVGMTVEIVTAMPRLDRRQAVRGFEAEGLNDNHRMPISLWS